MSRLMPRQSASAGQFERGDQTPAGIGDGVGELDSLGLELIDCRVNVVAHEIHLMVRIIARMSSQFGGWEGKDRPSVTSVDRRQSQHVPEECAHPCGFVSEDDHVCAGDHARNVTSGQTTAFPAKKSCSPRDPRQRRVTKRIAPPEDSRTTKGIAGYARAMR
jgi:hypothetical protein